jgi:hypothetical protein
MTTANFAANSVFTLALATLLGGCLGHAVKEVEYDKIVTPRRALDIDLNRDVDILFVIDNSGSMAEEQARLARNFPAFIAALDDMQADYRIGVTTTDVAHPGCSTGATPENGNLVLRSCLDAVDEGAFVFNDFDAAFACTDQCKLGPEQLRQQPSVYDGELHPWLESIGGEVNLAPGVAMADAFACYGPQGIDGCGYESPLEAMRLAITKARASNGNGFMRDEALLSVVLVTDEADCSSNPAHADIFTSNTTFQNDTDPRRTSATCWRAGTACSGDAPDFKECHAEDWAADGSPAQTPEDAVLHPVDRYVDFLAGLRGGPGELADDGGPAARDVLVSLITGVPAGYHLGEAEIEYRAAEPGSEQAINFGVAPGCVNSEDGSNSTAIPPVREREVAEAFAGADGARNLFSICQDDYSPALQQIARSIEKVLAPACAGACIADRDPATDLLEPDCIVTVSSGVDSEVQVPPCTRAGDGWATPADGEVCFYMLVDPDGRSEFLGDDMTLEKGQSAPTCSQGGENLEFKILRGGPRRPGVQYNAECVVASDASLCARA